MPLSNLSLLLITAGIAADNLIIAGISGNGFTFNKKWALLLILVFIIQTQVLYLGEWLGSGLPIPANGIELWFVTGGIFLIGFKMLIELKTKNNESKSLLLRNNNFLYLVFSTSVSVFALGFCLHYLTPSDKNINYTLLPLLILFMFAGIVLGKYHFHKIVRGLNTVAVLLVLAGGILLILSGKIIR